jgi:hypothetical protein
MNVVRLLPVLLSFLLLGAHFYRGAEYALVTASLLVPLLLFLRQPWVPRLIQLVLLLAAAEWVHTLWQIAQLRMQLGLPWERMAYILSAVALFTALSALVFFSRPLRQRYSGR